MIVFDFKNKKQSRAIYTLIHYEYKNIYTGDGSFDTKLIGIRHSVYLEMILPEIGERETCLSYVRPLREDEKF